jgi:DNA topoisomerase IB
MRATLPGRPRKANLDRLDDARSAIRGHQQRIIQATPLHVLEERSHRLGIFLGARHHVQQQATALDRKASGRQNRLSLGARPQTLGDAIHKQIRDLVLAQVTLRERLVILPQPLPKLRRRGLR